MKETDKIDARTRALIIQC